MNKVSIGEGNMPNNWKEWFVWALSPYRLCLFFIHCLFLIAVSLLARVNIPFAVVEGMAFLWIVERARETK